MNLSALEAYDEHVKTEGQSPDVMLLKDLQPGQAFYMNETASHPDHVKTLIWTYEVSVTNWTYEIIKRLEIGYMVRGELRHGQFSPEFEVFLLW